MEMKINLNTVVLALVLLALLIGGIVLFIAVRQMTQSLADAETLQERLQEIVNPTPTIIPDPVTIFHEIESLSKLETASYSVEKIITAESGQGPFGFLFGDRLILVAHGKVVAGVDLGKMEDGDIWIDAGETVHVTLPPAEVLHHYLDSEKSYIYDRDTGFVGMNPALESEARRAAEKEILNAAVEDGILDFAQENAETYLTRFILSLGFERVEFTEVSPVDPTSTP
ncbi:MAG: DUF4230 domain-containing protein [Anaerolineae bacterium]|jgi:uncharacterized protein YneF (UPF0154 family)